MGGQAAGRHSQRAQRVVRLLLPRLPLLPLPALLMRRRRRRRASGRQADLAAHVHQSRQQVAGQRRQCGQQAGACTAQQAAGLQGREGRRGGGVD